MKKCTQFLGMASFVVLALFTACSNDDDSSGATPTENPSGTVVSDVSALKVGSSVTFEGAEYLVTKNSFDTSARSAARAADITAATETDEEIAENLTYIQTYLDKAYRATVLEQETGITDCVELFLKSSRKESASGTTGLLDQYAILSEQGEKVAQIGIQWKANVFCKFWHPELTTTADQTAKFNEYTEEEIRSKDPNTIIIETFTAELKDKIKVSLQYNYSSDAETYGQIVLENPLRGESKVLLNSSGQEKQAYQTACDEADGSVSYNLCDNFTGSGQIIVKLQTRYIDYDPADYNKEAKDAYIMIRSVGDGKIGGSVKAADYQRSVKIFPFKTNLVNIQDEFGETVTTRNMVTGDYTNSVKFQRQTKSDSTWSAVGSATTVAIADLTEDAGYCISFASEKATVNGTEVPASVTYYAHYEKDESGNYPVKDKYARVTCYPEYDETANRIIYKLTKKSIEDFLNTYVQDFSTLGGTSSDKNGGSATLEDDDSLANDTTTKRFTFSGDELKIELEDMTTNFEITDDSAASGGKAGKLVDANSYAEAIITFPAGTYTGYAWINAPSADNDAFYVKFGDDYIRSYADDPIPTGYAKTSRTPIALTAANKVTVKLRIQKDSPAKAGETGMFIDYVLFTKD